MTGEHLDRAESASAGTLDRDAIRRRAKELGIPIARSGTHSHACALIAQLRRGDRLDPVLASILAGQLDCGEASAVPDDLADVVEWVGASDRERGSGLRDVLRLYDRIARSRATVREPEAARFRRFEVHRGRAVC